MSTSRLSSHTVRATTIIFSLIPFLAESQILAYDSNKIVQIELLQKEIELPYNCRVFKLNIKLKNNGDRKLLLYGVKRFETAYAGKDWYIGNDHSFGCALFAFNKKRELIIIKINDPIQRSYFEHQEKKIYPVNMDSIVNTINKNLILLAPYQTVEETLEIPLLKGNLKRGSYDFYILYFNGKYITNIIDESVIEADEKKYNALLFQGYAKSNTIKLTVK